MAEATRFKDVLEAQKKTDQLLQSETLRRDAVEARLQEQIEVVDSRISEQIHGVDVKISELGTGFTTEIQGMNNKFENLVKTLASIQLQLSNMSKGKNQLEDESILGDPPYIQAQERGYYRTPTHTVGKWNSGQSGYQSGSQFKQSSPKMDFPKFDGTNPRSWFLKCNHYFKMARGLPDGDRVHMACMSLEGKAALWYQNSNMGNVDLDWNQFVGIISARFEDIKGAKIIAEFNKLRQTGSYEDYVEKFEELKACMLLFNDGHYSEEHFIASFASGVSEDMQAAIDMADPKTLKQTIDIGKKHLLTMEAMTRRLRATNKVNNAPSSFKREDSFATSTQAEDASPYQKAPNKLLTPAEMAARREKGLCFNCDEKFVYGHRCKNLMKCMMMSEHDELCHYQKLGNAAAENEQHQEESPEEVTISLNAINGVGGVSIMKLMGNSNGHGLNILVDSGSTVSFIQDSTAKKLGCKYLPTKPVMVRVAGGLKLLCDNMVKGFKWSVQGHDLEYSMRVLDDLGCDLILGCDWWTLYSPVEFDFPRKTITIYSNGKKLKLQGTTTDSVECSMFTGPTLFHMIHNEVETRTEEVYALELQTPKQDYEAANENLLEQFKGVFEEQSTTITPGILIGAHEVISSHISNFDFAKLLALHTNQFEDPYGYKPFHFPRDPYLESTRAEVEVFLGDLKEIDETHLKTFADQRKGNREFEGGEMNYLLLLCSRQHSILLRKNLKLLARYCGPYIALEMGKAVAYKLDSPDSTRINLVLQLKKCVEKNFIIVPNLPTTDDDGEFFVVPTAVLNAQVVTCSRTANRQVLVRYSNFVAATATREDERLIFSKFRSFDPWGQGSFRRGGIVTERPYLKGEVKMEEGLGIENCFWL